MTVYQFGIFDIGGDDVVGNFVAAVAGLVERLHATANGERTGAEVEFEGSTLVEELVQIDFDGVRSVAFQVLGWGENQRLVVGKRKLTFGLRGEAHDGIGLHLLEFLFRYVLREDDAHFRLARNGAAGVGGYKLIEVGRAAVLLFRRTLAEEQKDSCPKN